MNQIQELKGSIKLIKEISKLTGVNEESINITIDNSKKRYYPRISVTISGNNYFNFNLSESPTGCGLMIIDNVVSFTYDIEKCKTANIVLNKIIELYLHRAGMLFATLGSSYYEAHEKNFKNLMGFEEISEYSNPNMSGKGQKIFIKKINQPKKEKKKEEIKSIIEVIEEPIRSYRANIYSYDIVDYGITIPLTKKSTKTKINKVAKQILKTKPIDAITVKRSRKSVQKL